MRRWIGPSRVVSDEREHVHAVQQLVTSEMRDGRVARMGFDADKDLHVTKRAQDIFEHLEHQGEYHIDRIAEITKGRRGNEYPVRAEWQGLLGDENERTWELLSRVAEDAHAVLRSELKST